MTVYAAVIIVHGCSDRVYPLLVEAANLDEANGKTLRIARRAFGDAANVSVMANPWITPIEPEQIKPGQGAG